MSLLAKIIWRLVGKPDEKEFRRKLPVFLICLFVAVSVWVLIKLSRTYEQVIKVDIEFVNQPKNAVIGCNIDTTITAVVQAEGFRLILWHWRIFRSGLRIDMNKLELPDNPPDSFMTIRLASLHVVRNMTLESRLPGIISKVIPESFEFNVAKRHFRVVPVVANLEVEFSPQHRLYSPALCIPDSIVISGPLHQINAIQAVNTEPIRYKRLNADVEAIVSLLNPLNRSWLELSQPEVTVRLDVENFTEASVSVPIITMITGGSFELRTFPESVKLFYQVALKDYKDVLSPPFSVLVRYDHQKDFGLNKLPVEVVSVPENVIVGRIEPDRVEYVLIH